MTSLWHVIGAAGVGVVSLAVYIRTACRTIYVGDSGELAAAVHTLGIPHPPGYPLYVLLGKLFSIVVRVGRPAWRLNLFSAFCASLSAVCLYGCLATLGLAPAVCAAVALTWALSASLWSQAGIPRVYALGAFISAAASWPALQWAQGEGSIGWLVAATFVIGLGLANHPVVIAHLAAFVVLAALTRPAILADPALWGFAGVALLPGLALYLFIPLRARRNPPVNWDNLSSWKDLWRFLLRKQYWRHRYVRNGSDVAEVLAFYLRRVVQEFGFMGAAAIVLGLVVMLERVPAVLAMALVLVLLNTAAMIAHARREDIFHWTRYMITAWFGLTFPLALGWDRMVSVLPAGVDGLVAFVLPLLQLLAQFRHQDLSRHRYAEEYNRRILECLPEGATLIAQDDNVVFPLMYLKYAEAVRPDVHLLEQGVHQLKPLKFNPRREAVYCTHWQQAFNQPASARGPGLRLMPEGVIYRIVSTDMAYQPRDLWKEFDIPDMEDPRIPRNYLTRCLLAHVYFMRAEWVGARAPGEAIGWYQRAYRMAPDSPTLNYNLGLCFRRMGLRLASEDAFARALALDRSLKHPDESLSAPGLSLGQPLPSAPIPDGSRVPS